MTHDNHPTAAPLTRDQVEKIRGDFKPTSPIAAICDMALASLTRPRPSDMTADVALVHEAITYFFISLECASVTDNQQFKEAKKALDRIVAHLSPRDAAPSGDEYYIIKDLEAGLNLDGHDIPLVKARWRSTIRKALDQARAEGWEAGRNDAATECEDQEIYLGKIMNDMSYSTGAHICSVRIRNLIPARQHS